jgi:hypothetical protein
LVVASGILCRLILGDILISAWLVFAGVCLLTAEFFNYWFGEVRAPAVAKELKEKLENQSPQGSNGQDDTLKTSRQEETVPQRNVRPVDEELE